MALIIIISIIIYIINITWTWKSLEDLEKSKKVILIFIGLLVIYIITLIAFLISQSDIQYENEESLQIVKNVLVTVFSGINGVVILPQLARTIQQAKNGDIDKQKTTKRISILLLIVVICMIFECGYMKDTQRGIIDIYQTLQK